jgi:hypothetical protein
MVVRSSRIWVTSNGCKNARMPGAWYMTFLLY